MKIRILYYEVSLIFLLLALSSCEKKVENTFLEDIVTASMPTQELLYVSESLNLDGLELKLNYSDGSSVPVSFSAFSGYGLVVQPENGSMLFANTNVTVSHSTSGKSVGFAVEVKDSVSDIIGNLYSLVWIGDQLWMKENLRTTKYNDGSSITLQEDNECWYTQTTEAFCWYENNMSLYGETYGALYNWYAVNTGNLCPDGWHVPNETEWMQLVDYLGGEEVAGGKLKDKDHELWNSPNAGATNASGFTAFPAGSRSDLFHSSGDGAKWWSSGGYDEQNANAFSITYTYPTVLWYNYSKHHGYSVRCIRD
jgi:uncharacterized protein (TIGR02145 family)